MMLDTVRVILICIAMIGFYAFLHVIGKDREGSL